ncbi:hypothetical protein [uncultured Streptomyces sp.]|uniref:hypothetical protein n=1 Tax=uncultured Streptomyces sp. TaxID=174707 RepID=UPI002635E568|nr:hypothetical protein [uncultured Streptomyces sp.]
MGETKAPATTGPYGASPGPAEPADGTGIARDAALWATGLARQFPDLLDELAPSSGSRPTVVRHVPGPAERAARAALTRTERAEALRNEQRGLAVPGHSAAPVRLHISDALRDITDGVVELEEALFGRLGLGRPRRAPVPERLSRIAGLLGHTAEDPTLARHARDELRRMARRCARALGETETMVRLPGRCPWCDSVSLRAFPDREAVLCVNPGCRCGDEACDCATDPAFRHLWERDAWAAATAAAGSSDADASTTSAPASASAAPAGSVAR